MADLVTRIAAEDAQFRAGMARVDSRLNQVAVSARRTSERLGSMMRGFGAFGAVQAASSFVEGLRQIREEAERAAETMRNLGQEGVNSLKAMAEESTKVSPGSKASSAVHEQVKAVEGEAARQIKEFERMSLAEQIRYTIANRQMTDTAVDNILSSVSNAQRRLTGAGAQLRRTLVGQNSKKIQDDIDKQAADDAARRSEILSQQAAERLSIAEELRDRQVQIAKESGNAVLAEQLRLEEEYRKSMKRISEAEGIGPKDRSMFGEAARQIRDSQMQAFLARRNREMQDRLPGGISNLAAGSAGAQQLTALMRDTANANREMAQDVRDILGQLGTIIDRIESPSYSVYAN